MQYSIRSLQTQENDDAGMKLFWNDTKTIDYFVRITISIIHTYIINYGKTHTQYSLTFRPRPKIHMARTFPRPANIAAYKCYVHLILLASSDSSIVTTGIHYLHKVCKCLAVPISRVRARGHACHPHSTNF